MVLAQVGEFSFVLQRAGEDVGLSPGGLDEGSEAFIAITVLLMVLSPFGIRLADWASQRLESSDQPPRTVFDADTPVHGHTDLVDHVVLAGYGERSRQIAAALDLADASYVVTTLDPDIGRAAAEEGRRVVAGDITRRIISEQAGVETAGVIIVADEEPDRTHQIAAIVKGANPSAIVLARVATVGEAAELHSEGVVDHVVADEGASVDALIGHTLGALALPERLVEVITQTALGTVADAESPNHYGLADPSQIVHTELAGEVCEHLENVRAVRPSAAGCEQCLAEGARWVHLRLCLTCGYVGCCDSSPHRHARAHHHETGHPMMRSAEPGENWAYCFVDRETYEVIPVDTPELETPVAE